MTGPDDDTRRIDPDSGDATQRIGPDDLGADDATRAIDPVADETQVFDETRAFDQPRAPEEPVDTQRFEPVAGVHAQGPRTERIMRPEQRSMAGWLLALALVVALAAGAAVGYAQRGRSDEGVVARSLVGPQGGRITFGKIGVIEIPSGALPTATAVTVRKVANENRVRLGAEGDPRSALYEPGELQMYAFEPADLRFQQPVKITIPRRGDGEALLVDTPDGARVVPVKAKGDHAVIETTSFAFDDE